MNDYSVVRVMAAILVAGIALVTQLWTARPAGASCAVPSTVADAIERTPVVFLGTTLHTADDGVRAQVQVKTIWKGDLPATVEIVGAVSDPRPNVWIEDARTYVTGTEMLFFAYRDDAGTLRDTACSFTQPYSADLERFAPSSAHPPPAAEAVAADDPPRHSNEWRLLAGAVAVLALSVLGLWAFRSRRTAAR